MMVIDEAKHWWFVSDRYQPEGKVCVYLFIPNDNRERVDSEDVELKRARASLLDQGFMETRIELRELIHLVHTEIPYGRIEIKKDFTFPIHDDIVYYTLDDIQSPEAKNYYEKVVSIHKTDTR